MVNSGRDVRVSACMVCGASLDPAARFCQRCGAPQGGVSLRSATRLTPLLQQWRWLKTNLTRKEVRKLLGEPLRLEPADVGNSTSVERWTYMYEPVAREAQAVQVAGEMRFAADGRLLSWTEPDWTRLNTA